jgi:hypothetical protein
VLTAVNDLAQRKRYGITATTLDEIAHDALVAPLNAIDAVPEKIVRRVTFTRLEGEKIVVRGLKQERLQLWRNYASLRCIAFKRWHLGTVACCVGRPMVRGLVKKPDLKAVCTSIGAKLRTVDAEILSEAIPDNMAELIGQLDQLSEGAHNTEK